MYLFRRLEEDTALVVLDMVRELSRSDFEPIDFEHEFSETVAGLHLRGLIDRLDGWEHDGRLYLRVADYKTGKKSFSLSDVWYGMGMQMLIYLFALQKNDDFCRGREIVPAGVLYAPARDVIVKAPRGASDDEIKRLREKELKRSGLILDDPDVIEAMENGGDKKYLPVKMTKSGISGDALASLERLGALSKHIETMLRRVRNELRGGAIDRDPYYKNAADNACLYCQYHAACHFSEDAGDRRRYLRKIKTDEFWEMLEKGADE